MQFLTLASLASIAAVALADSESFGLLVIRSGSQWQNSAVGAADGTLEAGVSGAGSATITDDGKLQLDNGNFVSIGSNDAITLSADDGSTGFSIKGGYLAYDGSQGFSINDDATVVAGSSGTTPVALKAINTSGSSVADFTPSGSSGSSSAAPESSSAVPESTSAVVETTATIETYDATNGAAGLNAGVAGVLAVAAMMI